MPRADNLVRQERQPRTDADSFSPRQLPPYSLPLLPRKPHRLVAAPLASSTASRLANDQFRRHHAPIPDPDKRFQVLAVSRGEHVIFVQVLGADTQAAIAMDLLSALEVAADINRGAVRALEEVSRRAGAIIDPETMQRDDKRWQQAVWQRSKPSGN